MQTNNKLHFVRVEDPKMDLVSMNVHPDFAAKNLAVIHDGSFEFATINAVVLREALLNTPELLARWGYKLVKIEEPVKVTKKVKPVEPSPLIEPELVAQSE